MSNFNSCEREHNDPLGFFEALAATSASLKQLGSMAVYPLLEQEPGNEAILQLQGEL